MKFAMFADDVATAQGIASIITGVATGVAQIATGQPSGYAPPSAIPAGYVEVPAGTPQATQLPDGRWVALPYITPHAADLPMVPILMGGAIGYFWKKSPLAALLGAAGGYFVGTIIGTGTVTTTPNPTALPVIAH